MKFLYFIALTLVLSISNIFAQQETLYKTQLKGNLRQGSVLFLSVTGTNEQTKGHYLFRDNRYDLNWNGQCLAGTFPIALDCPAGTYTLTVNITSPENLTLERKIKTTEHTYGKQQLWLSQSQLSTYDDPQADKDNDDLKKAISQDIGYLPWENHFIWPTAGHTSTLFGLKRFYNDDPEPEFHRGIDISAPAGQPIKAAQDGVVRFAKTNLVLHGDSVVINHGRGVSTLYIHMNSINVKPGQKVKQGDIIGTVGSKGVSTGPHLHWAAYSQGEPIDPKLLMQLPADWLNDR